MVVVIFCLVIIYLHPFLYYIRSVASFARELLTEDSPETTIDELLRIYPSEISEFLFTVKEELFEFLNAEVGELVNDLVEEVFEEVNVIE